MDGFREQCFSNTWFPNYDQWLVGGSKIRDSRLDAADKGASAYEFGRVQGSDPDSD